MGDAKYNLYEELIKLLLQNGRSENDIKCGYIKIGDELVLKLPVEAPKMHREESLGSLTTKYIDENIIQTKGVSGVIWLSVQWNKSWVEIVNGKWEYRSVPVIPDFLSGFKEGFVEEVVFEYQYITNDIWCSVEKDIKGTYYYEIDKEFDNYDLRIEWKFSSDKFIKTLSLDIRDLTIEDIIVNNSDHNFVSFDLPDDKGHITISRTDYKRLDFSEHHLKILKEMFEGGEINLNE